MAGLDDTLNWLVPLVLLLIAGGFLYTKFFQPYVAPMLTNLWEWMSSSQSKSTNSGSKKEIAFE